MHFVVVLNCFQAQAEQLCCFGVPEIGIDHANQKLRCDEMNWQKIAAKSSLELADWHGRLDIDSNKLHSDCTKRQQDVDNEKLKSLRRTPIVDLEQCQDSSLSPVDFDAPLQQVGQIETAVKSAVYGELETRVKTNFDFTDDKLPSLSRHCVEADLCLVEPVLEKGSLEAFSSAEKTEDGVGISVKDKDLCEPKSASRDPRSVTMLEACEPESASRDHVTMLEACEPESASWELTEISPHSVVLLEAEHCQLDQQRKDRRISADLASPNVKELTWRPQDKNEYQNWNIITERQDHDRERQQFAHDRLLMKQKFKQQKRWTDEWILPWLKSSSFSDSSE